MAAGLDRQSGNSLAEIVAERSQWAVADLKRVYGSRYEEKVDKAQAFIERIGRQRPGLAQLLNETGLTNDAILIAAIINLEENKGR